MHDSTSEMEYRTIEGPVNDDGIPAYLPNMFTDPRWKRVRSRRLYFAEIDGVPNGVVVATISSRRDSFLLNKAEFDRLLVDGLRKGKVVKAFVVFAEYNGATFAYQTAWGAEELFVRLLKNRPTISGGQGEFWSLFTYEIDRDPAF
jgi:hypothetical protein